MHLSSEIALDLIEGRLAGEQDLFWRAHLEYCKDCMREVERWQEVKVDLKRAHLQSASDETKQRVIQIFKPSSAATESRVRQVMAALVFDSFLDPALAGARGASATARQLVMRAEEFDIHVKIWGEPEHRQVLGQLLPREGTKFVESARFHLLQNGERLETSDVDETGEFHFTDVPEGDLSLQIDLPNLTVIGALKAREIQ
jgi:hypothetical protein